MPRRLRSLGRDRGPSQCMVRGQLSVDGELTLPGLDLPQAAQFGESQLQLKFGPSAWFANERDPNWTVKVDPSVADYSRLFITWAKTREIRQSAVTLQEVRDGLAADDFRLNDGMAKLVRGSD